MLELRQKMRHGHGVQSCVVNQGFFGRVGIEWPLQPIVPTRMVDGNQDEAMAQGCVRQAGRAQTMKHGSAGWLKLHRQQKQG
eukprot:212281-Pleurochrysis_carterae.AAC.1